MPVAEEKKKPWDEHHGLLGPIRVGPVMGTGFPNILSFGATAKLWGYVGLGFNYGLIPDMQVSFYGRANVRYREYDVYARVYPFKGGFYLGAGLGEHRVVGTSVSGFTYTSQSGSLAYELASEGSIRSLIVTPQVGYFRNFAFGLALGFGVGAQIPIRASQIEFDSRTSHPVPPEAQNQAEKQVHDTLVKIGKTPLPLLDVRVGWLF